MARDAERFFHRYEWDGGGARWEDVSRAGDEMV
jgi:hypothetical protein